jgi:excisionase family DNA binding protein
MGRRGPGEEPLVYTVPQAARLLQVSTNHMYGLVTQGQVPSTRFGKLIRIPRWGLLQYLAAASGAPVPLNLDVAMSAEQSVDGAQAETAED